MSKQGKKMRQGARISRIETTSVICLDPSTGGLYWRVYWNGRRYPRKRHCWYRTETEIEAIALAYADNEGERLKALAPQKSKITA